MIGYLGVILLTFSSIPQLVKTLRTRDVRGLSFGTLFSWSFGCFLMAGYIINTTQQMTLILNYVFNGIIASVILFLYFKYKK